MLVFSKSAIAALPTLAEMRLARRSEAASAMAEARLARRSEALAKRQAKIADTLTPIAIAKPEEPAIEPQAVMPEPITKPTMQEAPQAVMQEPMAEDPFQPTTAEEIELVRRVQDFVDSLPKA